MRLTTDEMSIFCQLYVNKIRKRYRQILFLTILIGSLIAIPALLLMHEAEDMGLYIAWFDTFLILMSRQVLKRYKAHYSAFMTDCYNAEVTYVKEVYEYISFSNSKVINKLKYFNTKPSIDTELIDGITYIGGDISFESLKSGDRVIVVSTDRLLWDSKNDSKCYLAFSVIKNPSKWGD